MDSQTKRLMTEELAKRARLKNSEGRQVYQWKKGGKWHIGTLASTADGMPIGRPHGGILDCSWLMTSFGELHWVHNTQLELYPAEPIPTP